MWRSSSEPAARGRWAGSCRTSAAACRGGGCCGPMARSCPGTRGGPWRSTGSRARRCARTTGGSTCGGPAGTAPDLRRLTRARYGVAAASVRRGVIDDVSSRPSGSSSGGPRPDAGQPRLRLVRAARAPLPAPELDPEQQRVLAHRGGPLRLLGAPGTGVTTTLVEAVVDRVVTDGLAPDEILVLAPTRRAAADLRERITGRLARTVR